MAHPSNPGDAGDAAGTTGTGGAGDVVTANWEAHATALAGVDGVRLAPTRNGHPATWREMLGGWERDASLPDAFSGWIAELPYEGVFWECAPLRMAGLDGPFDCVVLDGPRFAALRPEPEVFARELRAADDEGVATFPNLGGDALLVVAAARAAPEVYGHLAAFLRGAPCEQRRGLWRAVARAVQVRVGSRPLWLSTAGSGVTWLHVRLDSVPKYYRWRDFVRG